jgi:Superfamily I DNA and RNA helicases
MLAQDSSVEGKSKYDNVKELIKGIVEYSDMKIEEDTDVADLSGFLSEVALLTDQDNDKDEDVVRVTLMTVHAAKGLEFKNVFIVGLEEELFPSSMSKDSLRAIEEERRLFYVAITRAEENCFISYAKSRFRNGQSQICSPSRFLKDIDKVYLDVPVETAVVDPFAKMRSSYKDNHYASTPEPVPSHSAPTLKSLSSATITTSPTTTTPVVVDGLTVGVRVSHNRFGEGTITAIEGEGGDAKAVVEFDNSGVRQLLLKFAKLTIL